MTPEEAATLLPGEKVWVVPDAMLRGVPGGIYTVIGTRQTIMGGKRTVKVQISDSPETWVWPHHLGRIPFRHEDGGRDDE